MNKKLNLCDLEKDKITLKKALLIDGASSYSKVSKILAKIGDEKAQEIGLIPKIHSYNGNKRIFRMLDVEKWIQR